MTSEACDSDKFAIVVRYLRDGRYPDGRENSPLAKDGALMVTVVPVQQQLGSEDCGLFAIVLPSVQLEKIPSAAFPYIKRVYGNIRFSELSNLYLLIIIIILI